LVTYQVELDANDRNGASQDDPLFREGAGILSYKVSQL